MEDVSDVNKIDPYFFFNVPQNCTDEEIQESFYRLMRTTENRELVVSLYSKIRNQNFRKELKWNTLNSYIAMPYFSEDSISDSADNDVDDLIKKLAFLSPCETEDLDHVG